MHVQENVHIAVAIELRLMDACMSVAPARHGNYGTAVMCASTDITRSQTLVCIEAGEPVNFPSANTTAFAVHSA